ncbi:MAG: hypothetical protein LN412_06740, partial [Candidatus Thermoplasmatota archaeon]|nr:hypothetical protein [Candidatus Thermoplasmatota archaeon]
MTQNDDEHEENDNVKKDQDEEAETEEESPFAPDRLRESIRQNVDDALKEFYNNAGTVIWKKAL